MMSKEAFFLKGVLVFGFVSFILSHICPLLNNQFVHKKHA